MFIQGIPALWLIPMMPALGALLIFFFSKSLVPRAAGIIASTGVGFGFFFTALTTIDLLERKSTAVFHQVYWTWLDTDFIKANAGFLFDRISMIFCLIITGIGYLIHVYSTAYMRNEEGETRYFAYLSLFVASMLVLVLADNAFFMFLGWEGVGAMSFALIGHYYTKRENVAAAIKAFLVTRFGDVFLLLGVLLCALIVTVDFTSLQSFGSLELEAKNALFGVQNSTLILIAGLLLLGGAAGKSAQIPLQTWLPDAMAGPTPVSALIHAATMVTAGVYLIARFHILFSLSDPLMGVVAAVGCATAFFGATCAIVQTDIKRILAYSTISQIGYMILALGVGAYSLGLFHFFTHAFYKALLFLGAGTVIHSLHGEQNVYNMGGLKDKLKGTYLAMLAGAAALAGIPLTSGFFSKDAILWATLTGEFGNPMLYAFGMLTALMTAIYSFRMIYLVFHGSPRKDIHVHAPDLLLTVPLYILAFFALTAGFLNLPGLMHWEHFLEVNFGKPAHSDGHGIGLELVAAAASGALAIAGWLIARTYFGPQADGSIRIRPTTTLLAGDITTETPAPFRAQWQNSLFHGWKFDWFYNAVFVKPYRVISRSLAWIDENIIDGVYEAASVTIQLFHGFFVTLQNGRTSRYAMMMLAGAATICIILLLVAPGIL